MKYVFGVWAVFLILGPFTLGLAQSDWQTEYERSNYLATGTYEQDMAFCQRLADGSAFVELSYFGTSPEGRGLPLLTVDISPELNPVSERSIFVVAGIHAGEIDGKDAGLTFLRDAIIEKKYPGLLGGIRFYFVPIFNVDGHERRSAWNRANQIGPQEQGFRTTSQNLNLNRDWLKADAPEMRAMLTLIDSLNPDFLVDLHTTDGADYQYVISYSLNMYENELPAISKYLQNSFLPVIQSRMAAVGYDFVPYVVTKGAELSSGWVAGISPPRFSTGYGTLINRPFMLIETHSLKSHRERVEATSVYLRELFATVTATNGSLHDAITGADAAAKQLASKPYHLNWSLAPDSQMVPFKGVVSTKGWNDVLQDSIIQWGDQPAVLTIPFFDVHRPVDTLTTPLGYVIPRPWFLAIQPVLDAHGVRYSLTTAAATAHAGSYRFSDVKFEERPFEGRVGVKFRARPAQTDISLPAGSAVIDVAQKKSQVAIHLLEPNGPDSFVKWGFFAAMFEQKEYAADYIMDTVCTRLLEQRPGLKEEFASRMAADSAFAASPSARAQFFYERSEYWDQRKDLYPIGRIESTAEWTRIMKLAGMK